MLIIPVRRATWLLDKVFQRSSDSSHLTRDENTVVCDPASPRSSNQAYLLTELSTPSSLLKENRELWTFITDLVLTQLHFISYPTQSTKLMIALSPVPDTFSFTD